MGKEPDPHAYHPNSMDLNDAADMRDEAEQAFNDARKTRGNRDLLYVAVMACVIVMLTGAVCGRKDIIIVSTVIADGTVGVVTIAISAIPSRMVSIACGVE